ncbi:MAG: hypothetical protein R3C97_00620 [Geminicoccaceae bacterium]
MTICEVTGSMTSLYKKGLRSLQHGDATVAADTFVNALKRDPDNTLLLYHLGQSLAALGDGSSARQAWRRVVMIDSAFQPALLSLSQAMREACDWNGLDQVDRAMDAATEKMLAAGHCPLERPLINMIRRDDPLRNRAIAEAWAKLHAHNIIQLPERKRSSGRKTCIGYIGGQWYSHPVMQTMSFVMAAHDRERFEIIGFDCGPAHNDPFRRRALAAVDRHITLDLQKPLVAARRIRKEKIDILVDLTGHSESSPLPVLACRPAPVQLSYLGFIGTSGASYIDGLVTDPVLAMPGMENLFYNEKLVKLPDTFLSIGATPEAREVPTTRAEQGLPPDAFVLASFNHTKKLHPRMFDLWMEVLVEFPKTVLWLHGSEEALGRLRARAKAANVDPLRLIHAPTVNYFHHIARIGLADLALDTHPYGGGGTSGLLLRSDVPVITLKGHHSGSRMTASLLHSLGLDELTAEDIEGYKALICQAVGDTDWPARMKRRFDSEKARQSTLHDPTRLARQLEQLFSDLCMTAC